MRTQWEYDLVERPFCEQLQAMGWQWIEGPRGAAGRPQRSAMACSGSSRRHSWPRTCSSKGAAACQVALGEGLGYRQLPPSYRFLNLSPV
jgi:hypothetical protein